MFKNFTIADILLLLAAFLSLLYSEVIFFRGNKIEAIFVGLWVPSIIVFGIYLKLLKKSNHD